MPAPGGVVLSDLDDTLFDHMETTRRALVAVRADTPELAVEPLEALDRRHRVLLEALHLEVLAGRRSIEEARNERFGRLIADAGHVATPDRARRVARSYRAAYEASWQPVPGAMALVRAIRAAGWLLVIVTNNLTAEQQLKLDRTGLSPYVDHLVTSEAAGISKPDPRIFHLALERARTSADEAVMLGDAWATDIEGARAAGVRAVWLNRHGSPRPAPDVLELQSLEPTHEVLRALGIR